MFTTELYDIDMDGYVDLIVGGHDHEGRNPNGYSNTPLIFWGNGNSFNHEDYVRLPATQITGMGIVLDYEFFDIDNDGIEEIFICRTGDGLLNNNIGSYQGWAIQVLKRTGRTFEDITDEVIGNSQSYELTEQWIAWITWIDFVEIDGGNYLVVQKSSEANAEKLYQISNGRLVKIDNEPEKVQTLEHGICIYADSHSGNETNVDYLCKENPYSGSACIKFSNWKQYDGMSVTFNKDLENGFDLSKLAKEDYSLEFYIKNNDPNLVFYVKIESFINKNNWELGTYAYKYSGKEHEDNLGDWERIVVKLSDFVDWTDKAMNYWNAIDHIHIQTDSQGGQDFYLDEIRIRKIL